MDFSYLGNGSYRRELCALLVEKHGRIPAQYRNNKALIEDLNSILTEFDHKRWDKILRLTIKHDQMVSVGKWKNNEDEKWLRNALGDLLDDRDFSKTLYVDDLDICFEGHEEIKVLMDRIASVLGFKINEDLYRTDSLDLDMYFPAMEDIWEEILHFGENID